MILFSLDGPRGAQDVRLLVAGRTVATIPAGTRSAPQDLPATITVPIGGGDRVLAVDRHRARVVIARSSGARVELPARPVSAHVAAPAIAQDLRDNCETAALQVLLATTGVRVDQLTLQRELPQSLPVNPRDSPSGVVWGDPDAGFVGRADGTGPWGGFGVYPGPLADLAARHGRRLRDLTGESPQEIYRTLLQGRAVMVWVGLGDGPYRDWIGPSGRPIRVNLNEHTVVLHGVRRDGSLAVVNVLKGTHEIWTRSRFEHAWGLLGRRALGPA